VTVTVGAVGVVTVVVVVVVVVVEEVGATVVVVVALEPAAAPVEPVAPPPDELVARVARHTVSPMNSGVASEAELRRNNRACGTLKRAANRVHESFANTRCVEVHCGEGFTLSAGDEAMFEALAAAAPAPSDETTASIAAVIAMQPTRRLNIPLLYAVSKKSPKLHRRELQPKARITRICAVRPVFPSEMFSAPSLNRYARAEIPPTTLCSVELQ
jgi:hypothetical protein